MVGVGQSGKEDEIRTVYKIIRSPFVLSLSTLICGSTIILLFGYNYNESISVISYLIPILLLSIAFGKFDNEFPQKVSSPSTLRISVSVVWVISFIALVNLFPVYGLWGGHDLFAIFMTMSSIPVVLLGPPCIMKRIGLSREAFNKSVLLVTLAGGFIVFADLIAKLPFIFQNSAFSTVVEFFAMCVFPGVFEEITCRGLIQGALVNRWGNRYSAVMVTALFFGFYHTAKHFNIYGDIVLALVISFCCHFSAGVLFGAMKEYSNSVIPSIAVHIAGNATLLSIFEGAMIPFYFHSRVIFMIIILIIIGILLKTCPHGQIIEKDETNLQLAATGFIHDVSDGM